MAKLKTRRRMPPRRTLVGPLVMLMSGVAVGAVVWRILMLEPGGTGRWPGPEQLSRQDRDALERVLRAHP
jgi:hypothetical protein